MSSSTDLVNLFTSIGLSDQKAKETIKNQALANSLKEVINEVSVDKFDRCWTAGQ